MLKTKKIRQPLPPPDELYRALSQRDTEYDGVFYVAVRTTGIFCRPVCTARTPNRENVLFFERIADCLSAGFRPCLKCRPLDSRGEMPDWVRQVVAEVESSPRRRWLDEDLKMLGVEPTRLRRWFQNNLQLTFHQFVRTRLLASALSRLTLGDQIDQVAFDAGYDSLSGFREAFQKAFGITPGQAESGNPIFVNRIQTLLGPMIVATDSQTLWLLEFADRRMLGTQFRRLSSRLKRTMVPGETEISHRVKTEMEDYFAGKRTQFTIPLQLVGSEFQQKVWNALLEIPFGETRSYEEIAKRIEHPRAVRAVGQANGMNCLGVIVPCHRVIRSDGSLSGYGGGLRRKEWLLRHEAGV